MKRRDLIAGLIGVAVGSGALISIPPLSGPAGEGTDAMADASAERRRNCFSKDRSTHVGVIKYGVENLELWGSCPSLTNPKWIARYVSWLELAGHKHASVSS